jgi:tripartite-type tricarboxylate transporter receptor subunit TctC
MLTLAVGKGSTQPLSSRAHFMKNFLRSSLCSVVGLLGLTGHAIAAWPDDKPIELVIGFAAGGGQDVLMRTLQPFMERALKAKIVVVNKPGASGELAYTALAQGPADGYLMSAISVPGYMTMQIARKVKFDPADITPIARLVEDPTVLAVNSKSTHKTLAEVLAQAKAKPKSMALGGSGVGTDDHLAVMLFRKHGVEFNYVPFQGGAEALTALLGSHIAVGATSTNIPPTEPGIRALAVLSPLRSPVLPNVPTARELGIEVLMTSDRGLAMHTKVPLEIRRRVAEAVRVSVADPEFQAKAKLVNVFLSYMPGEQWTEILKQRRADYQQIWDSTPWVK